MGLAKIKPKGGACTRHSQSARWMPCAEAKGAARKRRRREDRAAVREQR